MSLNVYVGCSSVSLPFPLHSFFLYAFNHFQFVLLLLGVVAVELVVAVVGSVFNSSRLARNRQTTYSIVQAIQHRAMQKLCECMHSGQLPVMSRMAPAHNKNRTTKKLFDYSPAQHYVIHIGLLYYYVFCSAHRLMGQKRQRIHLCPPCAIRMRPAIVPANSIPIRSM